MNAYTPTIHQCTNLPPEGVSIYLDHYSTLLRRAPAWRLDIQREATEADLEENNYPEEVGQTLWTTSLEIRHCPCCGQQLSESGEEAPADFGRFVHIDSSGWHGRRL
jgi:hypothetical protein